MSLPMISVIGSLNVDLISRTPRIPNGGETLVAHSFDTGSGGKGANQAVACAKLSRSRNAMSQPLVEVQMVGAVGEDAFGVDLLKSLTNVGIETKDIVVKPKEKTGVAVILIEDNGENRILLSSNANFSLRPEQFHALQIPLPDLIILQLEIPLDTVLQILKLAAHQKVDVLLNPAPAQQLPKEALKAVTHLVVNESEASIIAGLEEKQIDWKIDSPERRDLLRLGPKHVIVTLGSSGGLYYSAAEGRLSKYEAKKVHVRDTTAAGDTFVGAYAVAVTLSKNRSHDAMMKAVGIANTAASITVQRAGAQAAIPWRDEVES